MVSLSVQATRRPWSRSIRHRQLFQLRLLLPTLIRRHLSPILSGTLIPIASVHTQGRDCPALELSGLYLGLSECCPLLILRRAPVNAKGRDLSPLG